MPSLAGHPMRAGFHFNARMLALAAVPAFRVPVLPSADPMTRDGLAARAIGMAGLVAIVALPLLLVLSLALGVALAVPAVIASGFLAVSQALAACRRSKAAAISTAVLVGLAGWPVIHLLSGAESMSGTAWAAAFIGPLFAASPAIARTLIAPRKAGADGRLLRAAVDRVACLDGLAPDEAVLILTTGGDVLAATRAARDLLQLLPGNFEHTLSSLFPSADIAEAVEALRGCAASGQAWPLHIARGPGRIETWLASTCEPGIVALRRSKDGGADVAVIPGRLATRNEDPDSAARDTAQEALCDMGEAVQFAMRRLETRAAAANATLASDADGPAYAACDPQVGRRVAHLSIDTMLTAGRGASIRVDAREVKGIVLLRVTTRAAIAGEGAESVEDAAKLETLRALVDEVGGTLVIDRLRDCRMLSVRLARANCEKRKKRRGDTC